MSDRKYTLLHYLADLINRKFPFIAGFVLIISLDYFSFDKELNAVDDGSRGTRTSSTLIF